MGNKNTIVQIPDPVFEPSKLKNIFLIGPYSGKIDFINELCENSKREGDFICGEMKFGLKTKVFMYDKWRDPGEFSAWKKLSEHTDDNYLLMLCYQYGERFYSMELKSYLKELYNVLHFTKMDMMMLGPTHELDIISRDLKIFRINASGDLKSLYSNVKVVSHMCCIGTHVKPQGPAYNYIKTLRDSFLFYLHKFFVVEKTQKKK